MIPSVVAIDEAGFPLFGERRISDPHASAQILSSLRFAKNGAFECDYKDQTFLVEAFDEPLIAQSISPPKTSNQFWTAHFLFGVEFLFKLESLTLDEWDRFHGVCETQIPFVMSREAQAQFFDLLEEFDDDSLTYNGKTFQVNPWMTAKPKIETSNYWSDVYINETPGWEMNKPAPALVDMLPRIKPPKSRVLVLGCGSGNDAAFFANQGHVVTAVDFAPEAIAQGKQKYGSIENLKFIQKDIFQIDSSWNESFDFVFEHTCYCAVQPEKRNDVVKLWKRVLVPTGQLMGIFFAAERRNAPPYGGTEWELRERLKKHFQFTFWGRWRASTDNRQGKELFVLATKRD